MSWSTPTTYLQRFGDALALLCAGARPSDEMMSAWLDSARDDHRLQEFAIAHGPEWAQGIAVIDAARVLADQPTEIVGVDGSQMDHERRPEVDSAAEAGLSVSLDGGLSYQPAPQGVRVVYGRVDVPGEDDRGEVHINHTHEGIVTDVWVTRDEPLDHNIGTRSELLSDLVGDLVDANE